MDIPSAETLHVFDHNFEASKINCCDCIESHIEQDESPFEECVDRVRYVLSVIAMVQLLIHTSCNLVYLVLNEEINKRNKCAEKATSEDLSILDCDWVWRT